MMETTGFGQSIPGSIMLTPPGMICPYTSMAPSKLRVALGVSRFGSVIDCG